jgi:hypothetical protein
MSNAERPVTVPRIEHIGSSVSDSSQLVRRSTSTRARSAGLGTTTPAAVDLYWIPLGAGGHCVRLNGIVYEALVAARERRHRCALYHAALVIAADGDRYTVEIAPSPDADEAGRGVVGTGAVGSRHLGRLRLFRYEVRCWRGGSIPDLPYAVGGPRRITADPAIARRLVDLVAEVPRPVWGRDELRTGDMWNSNSMVAWLIATAGLPTGSLRPPNHGRAPGWDAGLRVAARARHREDDDAERRCVAVSTRQRRERPPRSESFDPTGSGAGLSSRSAAR